MAVAGVAVPSCVTVSETKDARYNGSLPTPVAACMHDDDDGDDARMRPLTGTGLYKPTPVAMQPR